MSIKLTKMPQKILIVKPSSLGDIIHSLPFLGAIREAFPAAAIDWVVAEGFEGLLDSHPMVNRVWIVRKDRWKEAGNLPETLAEWSGLARDLAAVRYDLAIDLQGLLRSGLLTMFTRAPVRVGLSEAREGAPLFYTHRVEGARDRHAVDRYLGVAGALGADIARVNFPLPLVRPSAEVEELLAQTGPYAVIVPGARWQSKKWPAELFAKVASRLPLPSIVVGSRADSGIGEQIAASSAGKARSMAGKTTLKDLIPLMRKAAFVVTNDSGPMHLAAAAGVPVIALFGPTNPVRTGPYGTGHRVLTANLPCAPCYKKECRNPRCMTGISVDEVCKTVTTLLEEGR
jgi:lipopolysaccharide heptosyltransferase I